MFAPQILRSKMRLLIILAIFAVACSGSVDQKTNEPTVAERQQQLLSELPTPSTNPGYKAGSIVIGSTGFDAFLVEIDKDKRWKLLKARYNPSRVYEDEVTLEDITNGLRTYYNELVADGVSEENIHLLISSSAAKNPRLIGIRAVLEHIGVNVMAVTAEEEARFALMATIPPKLLQSSFLADIGSGNTKIAWMKNGEIKSEETYGSKYFQSETPDQLVFNEVQKATKRVPETNRATCFVIGGAPYLMVGELEKHRERYSFLLAPSAYQNNDSERINAGANIYAAIREESGTDLFIFEWDSNFSIGYLLTQEVPDDVLQDQ